MDDNDIKYFIEAALLAAGRPMSVEQLQNLFDGRSPPEKAQIRQAVSDLLEEYEDRGITISEVASGFRIEVKKNMADRLQKLWEGRSPRYSRALFETLALIAYRQPMTRGEIEEIRGVSVSTNIIRSLLEREWIRIVGHRDVPGRPAMFGTTKIFLDYFGLKQLDDLPPLADLSDWESLRVQLNLPAVDEDDVEVPTGEVTELPVLYPEGEAERAAADGDELPGSAAALDPDLEPIEATEWPDPSGGTTIIHTDLADTDEDAADDREEVDASLTGA
jgi:segregation and condensation protein B